MIEQAVIVNIKGRVKTMRGEALCVNCLIDDRGECQVLFFRNEFPVSLIETFLSGKPVDVLYEESDSSGWAWALPFHNQSSIIKSFLLSSLLKGAEQAFNDEYLHFDWVEKPWLQDPVAPHPMAETLNKLLFQPEESEIKDKKSEPDAEFEW